MQSIVSDSIKAPVKPVRSDDLVRSLCRWLLRELLLRGPTEQAVWESAYNDLKPPGVNLHLLSVILLLSGNKHFLGSKHTFSGKKRLHNSVTDTTHLHRKKAERPMLSVPKQVCRN